MILNTLLYKAKLLKATVNNRSSSHWTVLIDIIKKSSDKNLSKGEIQGIAIDLSYLHERHRIWIGNSAFNHLIITFLQNQYTLSRVSSEKMVGTLQEGMYKSIDPQSDEVDFFKYVVVSILTTNNLDSSDADTNLGPEIISMIQDSIKDRSRRNLSEDVVEFVPTLLTTIDSAVDEIFADMNTNPFALSVYRLHYSLMEKFDAFWQPQYAANK